MWRAVAETRGALVARWRTASSARTVVASLATKADEDARRSDVTLLERDVEEAFVTGWGKGGQKINKTRNCVLLTHRPTGLQVRCQETRSLDRNRSIARKLLLQKLDDQINGSCSKRMVKVRHLQKQKSRRRAKSRRKYGDVSDEPDCETETEIEISASDTQHLDANMHDNS